MGALIRRVARTMQTAMSHLWEGETPEREVIEYMYDPRHPREFYVYPPNDGTGIVRAIYTKLPPLLSTPEELGDDLDAWAEQELPIDDVYAEAIAHFVLHRAYSKEAEWALDPVRAKQHFELYLELVNTKTTEDHAWSAGSN